MASPIAPQEYIAWVQSAPVIGAIGLNQAARRRDLRRTNTRREGASDR
jgi:hypothetical protein